MKNNYKITDFPEGLKILFTDGEEWIVVKKGMRGSGSWRKSDEITIKPFNKLAKDKTIIMREDDSKLVEKLNEFDRLKRNPRFPHKDIMKIKTYHICYTVDPRPHSNEGDNAVHSSSMKTPKIGRASCRERV
jgi:hypothetical protein